jgi:hypothetical protein
MTDSNIERSSARAHYAQLLDQCHDMALIFSNTQLNELFEQAGKALLGFAERAQDDSMQGRFFEAMGAIQRQRAEIERAFRQDVGNGFENFGRINPPSETGREVRGANGEIELSLVDPEEMEESVAAENLIIRANATYFPELYALSQRLAVVNGGRSLKDYEIPTGPSHLVNSFRRSIKILDIDVKVKVILYALFDKFVVREIKTVYDEYNSTLKAAGILPNLKPVPLRPGSGASRSSKPQTQERVAQTESEVGDSATPQAAAGLRQRQVGAALAEELFDAVLDLMSTRGRGRTRRAGRGTVAADGGPPSISSAQVVSTITQLQSRSTGTSISMVAPVADIPYLEVDAEFIDRVKEALDQEREQIFAQVDRDKLAPVDGDLIDLIGMLFEYMLNDPVLPNLAKALLSHLHTPYLKVALIDRRLLVNADHPARRLLDQMVEAGSAWVDEANPQRGIFPAMQRVVDRVLREFTDNIGLFDELLAFFEHAMAEQERRTATTEERTQEAARGREALQLAKQRATSEIRGLIEPAALPEPVASFLSKAWVDQLVFILLRDPEEDRGQAWQQAVQTAQDLAALFEPQLSAAERETRSEGMPQLRQRIVEGVQRIGSYTPAAVDSLFALLDAPETWDAEVNEAVTAVPSTAESSLTEVVAGSVAGPEDIAATPAMISEQEQEVIQRLRKMKFGTWFEFRSETGGNPRRIKLSWLSPLTATCMFVDRSGMQAEIKTLQELAREILAGSAKIIPRPKHPFIERALVSIRKMLQGEEGGSIADSGQKESHSDDAPAGAT